MPVAAASGSSTSIFPVGAAVVLEGSVPTLFSIRDEDDLCNTSCAQGIVVRDLVQTSMQVPWNICLSFWDYAMLALD